MVSPFRVGAQFLLLAAITFSPAVAQESGAFVVRLGADTTSVERFTRTGSQVQVDQVGRSPRVLRRHAKYGIAADGSMTGADVLITRVGAAADAPPVQHLTASFAHDSVAIEIRADTAVRRTRAAVPNGAGVPIISPWVMYELLSIRLAKGKPDSLHLPMFFLGSPDLSWVAVRRMGRDSIDIQTQFDRYHARVDKGGHLLAVRPIRGTQQFSVDRVASVDVGAYATAFATREAKDGTLGPLSPRDTARATVSGANLWIDYGRPTKRGRVIFGGVVPWGEVWRTGANAATQFKSDKALAFGSTVVPAGFYTLWSVPTENGWTLIINSETGQWGTEHNPDKDLYRIPLSVAKVESPVDRFTIHIADEGTSGQIHFVWDQTVGAAAFTVQQ